MSARRQARGHGPVENEAEGVPRSLLIGPCIEVWSHSTPNALTARSRYATARTAWITTRGLTPVDVQAAGIGSTGVPWSVEVLDETGQQMFVTKRLQRARATRASLNALKTEADRLYEDAAGRRHARR